MHFPIAGKIEFIITDEFFNVFFLSHGIFLILIYHVDHLSSKTGIKLSTHLLNKYLSYCCLRERIPVASFRSHGIISICNGDNSCQFGYIATLELIRITSSIESLVMVMSADTDIREFDNTRQNLLTNSGMFLDLFVFFF